MSQHSSRGQQWEATRQRILRRDHYQCTLKYSGCTGRATQVDHLLAKANGGEDTDSNLASSCASCNNYKSSKQVVRRNWLDAEYFTD